MSASPPGEITDRETLLHPALTVAVVAVTGNHYWLDGIVATALLGVILLAMPRPGLVPLGATAEEPPRVPAPRRPAEDAAAEVETPAEVAARPLLA